MLNDIEIEVVDNGYIARIGKRVFVFSSLDDLDSWIIDTFKSPSSLRKLLKRSKDSLDINSVKDLIKTYEDSQPKPQPPMTPITPMTPMTPIPTPPNDSWMWNDKTTTNAILAAARENSSESDTIYKNQGKIKYG